MPRRSRVLDPSSEPRAEGRVGLRCPSRRPAAVLGQGSELQLPEHRAKAGRGWRRQKSCLRVPGRQLANRVGKWSHAPAHRAGAPVGDVCGKLSRLLLTPSNFLPKCSCSARRGLAGSKPELRSPEFLAEPASPETKGGGFILGKRFEKLQLWFWKVIPKETSMGYAAIGLNNKKHGPP